MKTPELELAVDATRGFQPLRRLLHLGVGLILVWILTTVRPTRPASVTALGLVVLVLLAFDLIRLASPRVNLLFFRVGRALASPREAGAVASSTWYMIGILIAVACYPIEAVAPAILVLALADPIANYVGRSWGRTKVGTGSLEGAAAFAAVALGVLWLAVPLPTALAAALAGALVEILPWRLDDNLTIPLAVSSVLWASLTFL